LIEDWRSHWGYEVPFFFVQLAGYGHNEVEPAEYPGRPARSAEHDALPSGHGHGDPVDIGDENDIHPKDKQGCGAPAVPGGRQWGLR